MHISICGSALRLSVVCQLRRCLPITCITQHLHIGVDGPMKNACPEVHCSRLQSAPGYKLWEIHGTRSGSKLVLFRLTFLGTKYGGASIVMVHNLQPREKLNIGADIELFCGVSGDNQGEQACRLKTLVKNDHWCEFQDLKRCGSDQSTRRERKQLVMTLAL